MVPSVHELAVDLVRRYALTVDDFVVEVGSGDGSLLRAIHTLGPRALGVEPDSRIAAQAFRSGVDTLAGVFHPATAADIRRRYGPARVVVSRTTRATADGLTPFVSAAAGCLAADGVVLLLAGGVNAWVEVRIDPVPVTSYAA